MGTCSLICIFYKGRFVIAQYTQWDGYPDGQGVMIVKFLLDPASIELLKRGLQHIYTPNTEELQLLEDDLRKLTIGNQKDPDALNKLCPSLSRDTGAKILELVAQAKAEKPVPVQLELEFVNDTQFCEWAYVVDLDENVFEVYSGRQSKSRSKNK